jgi:hypothetical protein
MNFLEDKKYLKYQREKETRNIYYRYQMKAHFPQTIVKNSDFH